MNLQLSVTTVEHGTEKSIHQVTKVINMATKSIFVYPIARHITNACSMMNQQKTDK